MSRDIKRNYESDEITVHWDSAKCIHSGKCVLGLPGVFDLSKHPWIDVSGATAEEIAGQVAKCPSGALTATRKK
jgi:uncharacterized Fe-S cluster protein YjdI